VTTKLSPEQIFAALRDLEISALEAAQVIVTGQISVAQAQQDALEEILSTLPLQPGQHSSAADAIRASVEEAKQQVCNARDASNRLANRLLVFKTTETS
jgi:hypothetical protein